MNTERRDRRDVTGRKSQSCAVISGVRRCHDNRESADAAPVPPQADAADNFEIQEPRPDEAAQGGAKEFGNNAFANLEFTPRQ